MKTNVLLIAAAVSTGVLFTSCKKEEEEEPKAKPAITINEIGEGNSKTATIGEDLHIDIDVVAEGKISRIEVMIHPEHEQEEERGANDLRRGERFFSRCTVAVRRVGRAWPHLVALHGH